LPQFSDPVVFWLLAALFIIIRNAKEVTVKQGRNISQHRGMSQEKRTHKVNFDEPIVRKYFAWYASYPRPQEWIWWEIFSLYSIRWENAIMPIPISVCTSLYMNRFYIVNWPCLGISSLDFQFFGCNCFGFVILSL